MTTSNKTLTDTEILDVLKTINYACLFVMSNGQRSKFGPGELSWQHDLQQASAEQREALSAKIAGWQKRSA